MEGGVLFGRPEDQEGGTVEGKEDLENVAERDEGQMVILDAGGGEVGRDEVVVGGEVDDEVVHDGGCHCGAVGWRVRASPLPTGPYIV